MASTTSNQLDGTSRKDDWSHILDPTSRKRVQNRIAQRNYRKNLKSRIEKLEQQATLVSTRQHLPSDGMLDISEYGYTPLDLVDPGLVRRSNGFASDSASAVEIPTIGLSGLCVDPNNQETLSFLSPTSPLRGNAHGIGNDYGSSNLASNQCSNANQRDYIFPTTHQQCPNMMANDQSRGINHRRFSRDSSLDRSETTTGSHGNFSLAEKIQAVLSAIHDAGFDGLGSFVSQYYTSDLTSSPNLANARRLSRNRSLPGILVDVRQNLPLWTEWERQRYKEEVLRSAEAILKTECTELSNNGRLKDFVLSVGQSKDKSPGSLLADMSTNLQNELPNLWALTTSLTMKSGITAMTGACDPFTTLSVMYLLSCSGIVSGEDLRKLAIRCLQD